MLRIGKLAIHLFGMVIKAENIQVSKLPVGAVLVFLAILPTMALLILI